MDLDEQSEQQPIDGDSAGSAGGNGGATRKRRNKVDPNFEQFELFLTELREKGDCSQREEADAIHRRWFTDEDYYSSLLM